MTLLWASFKPLGQKMGARSRRRRHKSAQSSRKPNAAKTARAKPDLPPINLARVSKRYIRRAAIKREKTGAWHRNTRGFCLALREAMRRYGDDVSTLHAATVREREVTRATLRRWVVGELAPRYRRNFSVLEKIEDRYGLDRGYFITKLLGRECEILKHAIAKVSDPLKRVLRWHVPDNFSALPQYKQEEILAWVHANALAGTTDFAKYNKWASSKSFSIEYCDHGGLPIVVGYVAFSGGQVGVLEQVDAVTTLLERYERFWHRGCPCKYSKRYYSDAGLAKVAFPVCSATFLNLWVCLWVS